MKADGKFSFTFNGEHWVWVDSLNKYESRGHQSQGRKTTTTTTTIIDPGAMVNNVVKTTKVVVVVA
jgi:hypothetical protein